jgi:hypothetical protein
VGAWGHWLVISMPLSDQSVGPRLILARSAHEPAIAGSWADHFEARVRIK